jgi:hypothetical protein
MSKGKPSMKNESVSIKSIEPILWMGPAVFKVTASDERRVLVRLGNHGWYACSSVREVHGGAKVAERDADLLEASKHALALAAVPGELLELEQQHNSARSRAAGRWKHLIERGASGKGPIGTESTGEWFVVELAGTMLPCGKPVLELFDRFSWAELEAIHDCVKIMGPDGWYWPLEQTRRTARRGSSDGV